MNGFSQVLKFPDEQMEKSDIENWDVAFSRKRKLPSHLEDSVVNSSLGKSIPVRSDEDLRAMWNQILDCQLHELNCRFQNDTYGIMKAAAACLPKSDTFGHRESLNRARTLYSVLSVFFQ